MGIRSGTVLLCLLLLIARAEAAPRTPSALVNGSGRLAQIGECGPMELTFDVRELGAAGVRVMLQRIPVRPDAEPAREWRFPVDHGVRTVKTNGLDVGIYQVVAVALDASGADLGGESFPIYVEYGGLRAWDGLLLLEDLRAAPPPFAGVGASYVPRMDMPRVELTPATSVLKPGGRLELRAAVRNMPLDSDVEWHLDGPGELEVLEPSRARYTAPDGPDNEIVRVRASVPSKAAEEGHATILVTPVKVDDRPE